MERSQRLNEPAEVGGGPRVANIQIVSHLRAAMECGCDATDDDKIDACVAECLHRFFKLH